MPDISKVRIIGGRWRGRMLRFPLRSQVRPTPDRVRETLFNWLRDHVADAYCLDLFCGSGALGFEALSRGARECLFVDNDPQVIRAITAQAAAWQCQHAHTLRAELPKSLPDGLKPVDIVFLDPPFRHNLLHVSLQQLSQHLTWRVNNRIYVETELDDLQIPGKYSLLKHQQAGQVHYYLLTHSGTREADSTAPAG